MNRKILFSILALLFFAGVVNAANIPTVVEPGRYPEVWTTEVYNNSGEAIASGWVVIWDFNNVSSPADFTDRLNYIALTTSADHASVAGVIVDDTCAIGATCTMAIRGPVYARSADSTDSLTASYSVGTTTLKGQCGQSAAVAVNKGILGWAISAAPNTVANGGWGGTDGADAILTPIFVNPSNN